MARIKPTAKATTAAERTKRKKRLGQLIREARGDSMTQGQLGIALGDIPQTTISRWELGAVDLTLEQVYDLEVALKLPLGTLSAAAGYAVTDVNARMIMDLMRSDPMVHPDLRADAIRNYKNYVDFSKRVS